jgi:hypothetical protein
LKTIEIIVSPTGQSTVQTKGFSGASCQEASRFLEQALGTRINDQKTTEFYQTQSESVRLSSQEGA